MSVTGDVLLVRKPDNVTVRVAAGGLIALSLAGLGYIGLACVEVFGKHRRRKLEASAAAQPR